MLTRGTTLLRRAARAVRERGAADAVARSVAFAYREWLRPRLPVRRRIYYAGIPTAVATRPGDRWVPTRWVPGDLRDIPEYEATLLEALRGRVDTGDRVVVVGGGVGVTATVAAQRVGPTGRVVVFEGGARGVRDVRTTAALNRVSDRLTVHHAVVARAVNVYGRGRGRVLHPADLPPCDVLELDCEGAEVEILREMVIRPRAVVVETHGLFGAPTDLVRSLLDDLGYDTEVTGLAEPRIPEICEENDIRVVVAVRGDA